MSVQLIPTLKTLAITALLSSPCIAQSNDLQRFIQQDTNEDGFLSGNEIGIYRKLDTDGNGKVTRQEFLKSTGNPSENVVAKSDPTTMLTNRTARPTTDWDRSLRKQLEAGSGWAISIGVDEYATDPLKCCVADARLIAETLQQRCGFPSDQILLLTDKEANKGLRPTKSNLKSKVSEMLKRVQENDTVVVSFAGHGILLKGTGYLCPLDFDGASAVSSGWEIDELRVLLQNCKAARKLLILDSCHSGGSSGKAAFGASGMQVGSAFKLAQGQITFSSCRADEQALESREDKHGLFTLSFARGMEGSADFDQNGIVDSDEIYRHVLTEVPAMARDQDMSHHQTPVRIIGQDVVGVFALAPVRTGLPSTTNRKGLKPGDVVTNSIGLQMVMLPKGITIKGSPLSEYKRGDDEDPRGVILTKRLFMGTHEVSQREYQTTMSVNPSYYSKEGKGASDVNGLPTDRFPVEQVAWSDAVEFCTRLTALSKEQQAGRIYRLPTESEWEFACRGNSLTAFNVGEIIEGSQANIKSESAYWYSKPFSSLGRTRTIGSYPSNAFGLFDMHGNVAEWCSDFYDPIHVGESTGARPRSLEDVLLWLEDYGVKVQDGLVLKETINPVGPRQGTVRVVRGGSFNTDGGQARSAARRQQNPAYKHRTIGFRIVCEQRLPTE